VSYQKIPLLAGFFGAPAPENFIKVKAYANWVCFRNTRASGRGVAVLHLYIIISLVCARKSSALM
jgi:hypothetical protein